MATVLNNLNHEVYAEYTPNEKKKYSLAIGKYKKWLFRGGIRGSFRVSFKRKVAVRRSIVSFSFAIDGTFIKGYTRIIDEKGYLSISKALLDRNLLKFIYIREKFSSSV